MTQPAWFYYVLSGTELPNDGFLLQSIITTEMKKTGLSTLNQLSDSYPPVYP